MRLISFREQREELGGRNCRTIFQANVHPGYRAQSLSHQSERIRFRELNSNSKPALYSERIVSSQELWESEECIGIGSVQFEDDRIAILDVTYPPVSYLDDRSTMPGVRINKWDSFDRLVADGLSSWTVGLYDSVLHDFSFRTELLRCRAGECGGDGRFGFVSTYRIADDHL